MCNLDILAVSWLCLCTKMSTEQQPPFQVMKEWEFLLFHRLVPSRLILSLRHHVQGSKIVDEATEESQENGRVAVSFLGLV